MTAQGIIGSEVIEFWPDIVRHHKRKQAEKLARQGGVQRHATGSCSLCPDDPPTSEIAGALAHPNGKLLGLGDSTGWDHNRIFNNLPDTCRAQAASIRWMQMNHDLGPGSLPL